MYIIYKITIIIIIKLNICKCDHTKITVKVLKKLVKTSPSYTCIIYTVTIYNI